MPLLLLLLAFERRLNPLRSLYRENRIEYIGKRGNFWGGKKIEEGKKKRKGEAKKGEKTVEEKIVERDIRGRRYIVQQG